MGIIRFILALSVAVWHLPSPPFRLLNASVAVLAFFMISGFYMAMVLTEKYNNARSFFVARFWRLYPAYAAMAAIMVFWFALTNTPTAFTARLPVSAGEQAALALINIFVVGQDVLEFWRNAFGTGGFLDGSWILVGQAWSLSSEFFFYCLAPFVARSPRRILALLIASLAVRALVVGWFGLPSWIWGYYFFPGALCMFLMGSLAYHVHSSIKLRRERLVAVAAALGWSAWLIYGAATAGIMLPYGPGTSVDGPVFWFAYVAFAASIPFIFSWSKNNRIDRAIGDLSYPLYLVHGLVLGIVFNILGAPRGQLGWALLGLGASIGAAITMRVLIEVPVETYRPGFVARLFGGRQRQSEGPRTPARDGRPGVGSGSALELSPPQSRHSKAQEVELGR
jgi:peptidoglycan/LPS O-acetylase OafA/YrhL